MEMIQQIAQMFPQVGEKVLDMFASPTSDKNPATVTYDCSLGSNRKRILLRVHHAAIPRATLTWQKLPMRLCGGPSPR